MRELVRAIASHAIGYVQWRFIPCNGAVPGMGGIFDAVDDFLLNRPGYRVTIVVEREDGTNVQEARDSRLLADAEPV